MNFDIIIPTFNRAHTLSRAIDSVLAQTYQDFNLQIVDDGSTDNTQDILDKYKSLPNVTILHQSNQGVSAARNLGVENSSAPWICFLDSDDCWLEKKLKTQQTYIDQNPCVEFLHSEEIWMRNNIRVNPKIKHRKTLDDLYVRSLEFCLISPSTVAIKRSLLLQNGSFDQKMIVCEDYDLWLKCLSRMDINRQLGYISDPLVVKYGGHEDQLSTKFRNIDAYRFKSLFNLFFQSDIKPDKKILIRNELSKKADFLMMGYIKHQNNQAYQQVKDDLAKVMSSEIIAL